MDPFHSGGNCLYTYFCDVSERNDVLQSYGSFLEPESAQKIKQTSKQWSDVNIYENIFPNESKVAVFRNANTEEILWETITFTKSWTPMPQQNKLGNNEPN